MILFSTKRAANQIRVQIFQTKVLIIIGQKNKKKTWYKKLQRYFDGL